MLHLPTSTARPAEIRATGHPDRDRAMDVLQYGLAVFVIVIALLLGTVR